MVLRKVEIVYIKHEQNKNILAHIFFWSEDFIQKMETNYVTWFIKYFIQSQHNFNIQSTIHSFGYMFRFHHTILMPVFIIWRYIRCVRVLWDLVLFTLIKAKIIPVFNNFYSKLMYFFKLLIQCTFKNICKNSYQFLGTFIVKLKSTYVHLELFLNSCQMDIKMINSRCT